MAKKQYKVKHEYLKSLGIPKRFLSFFDSAVDHTGELINKLTIEDILLMYLGFQRLPKVFDPVLRALWGPIALKLATTPTRGEGVTLSLLGVQFPVNSQVAGLSMLGILGFASVPWEKLATKIAEVQADKENTMKKLEVVKTLPLTDQERARAIQLEMRLGARLLGPVEHIHDTLKIVNQFIEEMKRKYASYLETEKDPYIRPYYPPPPETELD